MSAQLVLMSRARQIAEQETLAVAALAAQLDESLFEIVEALLACEGHTLVAGAGTSNAIARRFAHLLSCAGTPALAIDVATSLHGGSGAIRSVDLLYVISKGGRSSEINQLATIAHKRGARVIAQTEAPNSPLGLMADLVWHVVAPAGVDPLGMIATGSSLVNAAAGDVLCTLLLEMRGYTLGEFATTHPGGVVGHRLSAERKEEGG